MLELALLLAIDKLREREGGDEIDWLERLVGEAEQKLREQDRLPRPFLRAREERP